MPTQPFRSLRRFQAGKNFLEEFKAENFNAMIDAIEALRRDVQINTQPDAGADVHFRSRLATVTNAGPRGVALDPDTATNVYWVKPALPQAGLTPAGPLLPTSTGQPDRLIVKATNLAELASSHQLPTTAATVVQLFRVYVNRGSPVGHWFFWRLPDSATPFPVKVTGATQNGTNKRWGYTGVEMEKLAVGHAGWSAKTGGREATGATNGVWMYNLNEQKNGASGTYGNGVSSTNLTGTFDIQRIPNDTLVWARVVTVVVAGVTTTEWVCEVASGVDGACP